MKGRFISLCVTGLMLLTLTSCNAAAPSQPADPADGESDRPQMTSFKSGAGQDDKIDDMLPELSDETRVISVEEAEKLMEED